MWRVSRKFDELVHPKPGASVLVDIVILGILGSLFLLSLYDLFFYRPDPNAYACGGPGFVDFGCAGGWEATVNNVTDVLFVALLFGAALMVLLRLINRKQRHHHEKK